MAKRRKLWDITRQKSKKVNCLPELVCLSSPFGLGGHCDVRCCRSLRLRGRTSIRQLITTTTGASRSLLMRSSRCCCCYRCSWAPYRSAHSIEEFTGAGSDTRPLSCIRLSRATRGADPHAQAPRVAVASWSGYIGVGILGWLLKDSFHVRYGLRMKRWSDCTPWDLMGMGTQTGGDWLVSRWLNWFWWRCENSEEIVGNAHWFIHFQNIFSLSSAELRSSLVYYRSLLTNPEKNNLAKISPGFPYCHQHM